jgi:hypothetical protein
MTAEQKWDLLLARFDVIEARLSEIDGRLVTLDDRTGEMSDDIDKIEGDVDTIRDDLVNLTGAVEEIGPLGRVIYDLGELAEDARRRELNEMLAGAREGIARLDARKGRAS